MASPLLPYAPSPLGEIAGLTADPATAARMQGPGLGRSLPMPQVEAGFTGGAPGPPDVSPNTLQMSNEAMDHGKGRGQEPPGRAVASVKTDFPEDGGAPTHTLTGVTDEFLEQIKRSVKIGQQAEQAFNQTISDVQARKQMLEQHPIVAGVGRIASLASLAYQTEGLRGRAAAPLVHAAGQFGADIFSETPMQLGEKVAQLETQKLATSTAIGGLLERGYDAEVRSQDRKDALDQADKLATASRLEKIAKDRGDDAAKGYFTESDVSAFENRYVANGGTEKEAKAISENLLRTSAEALKNRTPAGDAMRMRAGGATRTGNSLVDAMTQRQAQAGLTVRSTAAADKDKLPEKYRVPAAILGIPNDQAYITAHPDVAKKLEQYAQFEALGLDVDATARLLVESAKDNPMAVIGLRDVAANFARGSTGVAFRNAVVLRARELDSTWSPTLAEVKLAKIKDFYDTSKRTASGSQRRSFDTLLTHAGTVYDMLNQIAYTTNIPVAQLTINKIKDALGNEGYQMLKGELDAVQREYPTLLAAGYAPYKEEVDKAVALFGPDGGKKQIIGSLKAAAIVANGRWNALNTDFKHTVGVDFPEPFGEDSIAAAEKLGVTLGPHVTNPILPPGTVVFKE